MKLLIVVDNGYVYLDQLWRGDITVRASEPAKLVAGEIVERLGGYWTGSKRSNWIVHPERALALFEALYELSLRAPDTGQA